MDLFKTKRIGPISTRSGLTVHKGSATLVEELSAAEVHLPVIFA
ncbi:MAG: hypothetical protein U9Q81_18050 [Pseudomonadota bacterium]|nr:hypothetical protein [Pseudomonadota bacterium]